MNTRKMYFAASILFVISILSLATLIFMLSNVNSTLNQLVDRSDDIEIKVSSLIKEEATLTDNMFLLKEYNGIIGVFDEYGDLTDVIEVNVKSLPRQDQTMLSTGIWAASREELAALIEDYTG